MSDLQKEIDRGQHAARLLSDTTLTGAFEAVERAIHDQWSTSPIRDREGQHELRLMLKLLGDVRTVLETAVADGRIAAEDIKRAQSNVLSPKQWMGR